MHDDSPASKTALMVAGYRARASARPTPLCRDPWAAALAGSDGLALAEAFDAHMPHMELWLAVRVEYLDRQVRHLMARGASQVVILGAGLDTRSARLARAGVDFFEVDHPATQADKRERVAALTGYPDAARYVACDFERGDDVVDRLLAAGLSAERPTVVVWEGVTPYLSEAAVRATATRLADGLHPASTLLFDYVSKRMAAGDRLREQDHGVRDQVGELGEPLRFGTDDPLPLLYECGFRHVRTVSFDQACLSLTGSYERARAFRFQGIALASRLAPEEP
jgi:methyltransferase (TIGR00027 family)